MSDTWYALRATLARLGPVPVLLRGIVLASSVVAILATTLPSWDVANGYVYLAALSAVVATVLPDSGGGLFFAGAIVIGWVTGSGTAVVGLPLVLTALALLAGHVAGALAAAMPSTAAAPLGIVACWWQPTVVVALAVVATTVAVRLLAAWDPPGSIVVVIAALGVASVAVWRWSAVGDDEPST